MNSSLRIAVAEITFQAKTARILTASPRSYSGQVAFKSVLYLRRYCLPLSGAGVRLIVGLLPNKIQGKEHIIRHLAKEKLNFRCLSMDKSKLFGSRWGVLERAVLQLQRRQGQVRHELD